MLLDELRAKKTIISALSEQYGAQRIRVFGSVARGEERPDSDVDFLVDFPRGYIAVNLKIDLKRSLCRQPLQAHAPS